MAIVSIGPQIFGVPEGVNVMDLESIRSNMDLYQPKHFIAPILAHGIGTLVGAFVAAKISLARHMLVGLLVAVIFLLGGITMVTLIPEQPTWVKAEDLLLAYFPMAYLGVKLAR